jgi:hypothetical protein
MNRLAVLLALVGVALLSNAVVAPAEPTPNFVEPPAVDPIYQKEAPVLAQMNAQVERLQQRTSPVPEFPETQRDPFRFGTRPEPPRPKTPVVATPAPVVEEAPVILPKLVAIVANATDGGLLRTAVLSFNDDVQILKPGETIGKFVVRAIAVDGADLVDPATGATFHISLR